MDTELIKLFTRSSWLPDGVLSSEELIERIGNGMVSQESFEKVRKNKLAFFQFFNRGWKPFVLVSGKGENERIFKPESPWR